MKKLAVFVTVVFVSLLNSCYQKKSGSNISGQPQTTATVAAPATEKSIEPAKQAKASGDYTAALNYFNSKEYEKAATEFEAVVKTDEKNQRAQFYLGKSYQSSGKTDSAIGAFRKAIAIKPDDAEANYELGKVYLDKKDFAAALPFIEKAAKIKYTSTEYLVALGDNYRELNKCDYAMVPYGKVSGFDDKNTAAYYGMGLCYIELKNRIAAGQQVRNLEKLDKDLAKKLADKIPK